MISHFPIENMFDGRPSSDFQGGLFLLTKQDHLIRFVFTTTIFALQTFDYYGQFKTKVRYCGLVWKSPTEMTTLERFASLSFENLQE